MQKFDVFWFCVENFFSLYKMGEGDADWRPPLRPPPPPFLYDPDTINKLNNLGLSEVEPKNERELPRKVQFVK